MMHPISFAVAYSGLALAVFGMLTSSVLFAAALRQTTLRRRGLQAAVYGASAVYGLLWALLLALAAAGLTLETRPLLVLRWSMALLTVLSALLALLEHEWLLLLPGLFAVFTLPFFETAFGPVVFPYLLLTMLAAGLAAGVLTICRGTRRRGISLYSIQEALDALDDGVLFAREDGSIVLGNRLMQALSTSLCRAPLRNAQEFWDALDAVESTDLLTKVRVDGSYLFRFAGGNTWTLHRETLQVQGVTYVQIVALNVTESDGVQRRTAAHRAELAGIAAELRQVEETIVQLQEEEARVARGRAAFESITEKMSALNRFFTEHYALPADTFDYKKLAELTAGLLDELEHAPALTPAQRLELTVGTLRMIGVAYEQDGALPEQPEAAEVLADLLRETAVNAVMHGGAGRISVRLEEREGVLYGCIVNDGSTLDTALTPGGGITGIRRKLFPLGGSLEIEKAPVFTVNVRIPLHKAAEPDADRTEAEAKNGAEQLPPEGSEADSSSNMEAAPEETGTESTLNEDAECEPGADAAPEEPAADVKPENVPQAEEPKAAPAEEAK